jgi:hypothetical protein
MHGGDIVGMIFFLVTGIVLVSFIFFRSREKQMMIEKGLSYEQMVELLRTKRDPYIMLKLGILTLFVGLGLGIGFLFEYMTRYAVYSDGRITDYEFNDQWMAFWIVVMTGLGFVSAFFVARKLKKSERD